VKPTQGTNPQSDTSAEPLHLPRESPEFSRSFLLRYGCAVVSIAIATWLRLLLDPLLGDQFPFPTLLLAVLLTAWYGGLRPALLAVALGTLCADYFLLPPRFHFQLQDASQYVGLATFVSVGVGIALPRISHTTL
jgi:K+-sensing histidine kinase KdpD